MKNREYKTLVAIATASALLVGSLGVVSPSLAQDDKTTMTQTVENTDQKEISTKNITNAKPFKSETVYAKIDGNGNVSSVTVSDQLKNIDNMGQLKDTSILKNIENVKGEEKFSQKQSSLLWDTDNKDICYQGTTEEPLPVGIKVTYTLDGKEITAKELKGKSGHSLLWDTDNKDICYQGTTEEPLPVGIKVTYTLDGKEITAKELKGKSGHLVMRYQYTNETASESEYVPFAMVTGLIFDTDKISNVTLTNAKMISDGDRDVILGMGIPALKEQFDVKELVTGLIFDTDKISNVTLTNAKMISDGDRDVILGMGIPALKEQFDVKELDIPDYFEVEADVKDYELSEGMTIATNDIFNDLETDKFDSLSELKNSMKTLQDSANKLVDGSGELRKGLDTLLSS